MSALVMYASGGDGLDSNGSMAITGGTVLVDGPTMDGNGALDVNGTFTVDGGTLLATGSAGMAQVPSTDSAQGWVAATLSTPASSGQVAAVVTSDGEVVARYVLERDSALIVLAADGIEAGETYDIYVGEAGDESGYSTGGSAEGLDLVASATAGDFSGGQMGRP
jgi:hypothetical protein